MKIIDKLFIPIPMHIVWKDFVSGEWAGICNFNEGDMICLNGKEVFVSKIEKARKIIFTVNSEAYKSSVAFNFYPEPGSSILEVLQELFESQDKGENLLSEEIVFWKKVLLCFNSFILSYKGRMA